MTALITLGVLFFVLSTAHGFVGRDGSSPLDLDTSIHYAPDPPRYVSFSNELTEPDIWLDENATKEVYRADPCVEAMRGAMVLMEQFMPDDTFYQRISSTEWKTTTVWTVELMSDYASARRVWAEVKLQCSRKR